MQKRKPKAGVPDLRRQRKRLTSSWGHLNIQDLQMELIDEMRQEKKPLEQDHA
jgi:hypothetical protein